MVTQWAPDKMTITASKHLGIQWRNDETVADKTWINYIIAVNGDKTREFLRNEVSLRTLICKKQNGGKRLWNEIIYTGKVNNKASEVKIIGVGRLLSRRNLSNVYEIHNNWSMSWVRCYLGHHVKIVWMRLYIERKQNMWTCSTDRTI